MALCANEPVAFFEGDDGGREVNAGIYRDATGQLYELESIVFSTRQDDQDVLICRRLSAYDGMPIGERVFRYTHELEEGDVLQVCVDLARQFVDEYGKLGGAKLAEERSQREGLTWQQQINWLRIRRMILAKEEK